MTESLKPLLKRGLVTALALSLVITFLTPLMAGALTTDVTTAKGNETSTGNVLGGTPTRVTWESVVDKGESVSGVTVQFPEGSDLTDATTVRVTVLDGTTRLNPQNTVDIDTNAESVKFFGRLRQIIAILIKAVDKFGFVLMF